MSFFFPCMNCPEKGSINFSDTALQDGAVIPTWYQEVANLVTQFILAHWFSLHPRLTPFLHQASSLDLHPLHKTVPKKPSPRFCLWKLRLRQFGNSQLERQFYFLLGEGQIRKKKTRNNIITRLCFVSFKTISGESILLLYDFNTNIATAL